MKRTATQVYAALTPMQREDLFARKWMDFPASAINPQLAEPVRRLYQDAMQMHERFIRPEDGPQPKEKIEDYERRGIQFALHSMGGKVMPAVAVFGNGSMSATFFADLDARRLWPLPPHGNPYTLAPVPRSALLPDAARTQQALREKELGGSPAYAFYACRPPYHGRLLPFAACQCRAFRRQACCY